MAHRKTLAGARIFTLVTFMFIFLLCPSDRVGGQEWVEDVSCGVPKCFPYCRLLRRNVQIHHYLESGKTKNILKSMRFTCPSSITVNLLQVRDERAEDCWHRKPGRAYGTVLCGCAAALGFATIENVLYCWADLAVQTAVLRAILAVPGHCAGGVIIAVGVTERVFYGKDTNAFWILLPSVMFHGFYDWFLMASAIGYLDSQETGENLALAGLTGAMMCDMFQFLYMFRRLNILEEIDMEYAQINNQPDEYE